MEHEGTNPLFQGLTRPSMMLGIPLEAFMATIFATGILFLMGGLIYLLTFVPFYLTCRIVTAFEPRIFELVSLWLQTKGSATTRSIWQCSSYSPFTQSRKADGRLDHDNLPIFV